MGYAISRWTGRPAQPDGEISYRQKRYLVGALRAAEEMQPRGVEFGGLLDDSHYGILCVRVGDYVRVLIGPRGFTVCAFSLLLPEPLHGFWWCDISSDELYAFTRTECDSAEDAAKTAFRVKRVVEKQVARFYLMGAFDESTEFSDYMQRVIDEEKEQPMTRRTANLPLKEGDTVVLKEKGKKATKGKVTRGSKRDALVQGHGMTAKLKLRSKDGDEQELTIEVDQRDGDGRELLLDE